MIKLLVDAESEQVLGATCLGLFGDEIVQVVSAIMHAGASYRVLKEMLTIHPTVAEFFPTILGSSNKWIELPSAPSDAVQSVERRRCGGRAQRPARTPPSTGRMTPVIQSACAEAKNIIALTTSCGVPMRPMG